MYTITYIDLHYRSWQDDHVFQSFDEVKEFLYGSGFVSSKGAFSRGKYGWCEGLRAYPKLMKKWKSKEG